MVLITNRINGELRIGLVVDHPLRDLDGLVLVSHLLAQRGHRTVLIPFYAQNFDLPSLDLDLVVVNYLRPANEALVRATLSRGTKVAVLDTEGALRPAKGITSYEGSAVYLQESGLDEAISLYMLWGEAMKPLLLDKTALGIDRIEVTGCPRFDLAHPPWSLARDAHDFVLVNTAFPTVNSRHAREGREDREALRATGFADSEINEIFATYRAIMADFCDAVARLAAARPTRRFVVRPHPFEASEPYEQRFAQLPNVALHRTGSVLDVLAQSDCLLHVNCTTAIEAVMCGVPPISLDFANRAEAIAHAPLPGRVSHRAQDLAAALKLIDQGRSVAAEEELRAVREIEIRHFFGPCDGKSAVRVADAVERAAGGATRVRQTGVSPRSRILAAAGDVIGSKRIEGWRQRRFPGRADKQVSAGAVKDALDRFARADKTVPAEVAPLCSSLGSPMLSFEVRPVGLHARPLPPAMVDTNAPAQNHPGAA